MSDQNPDKLLCDSFVGCAAVVVVSDACIGARSLAACRFTGKRAAQVGALSADHAHANFEYASPGVAELADALDSKSSGT